MSVGLHRDRAVSFMALVVLMMIGSYPANAQIAWTGDAESPQMIDAEAEYETSEFVTINVEDANISEVLKAYSLQTGQSIVVGPDVVSDSVNVRLNNIPWEEALDVILKPYGFGYRIVGDTIIISRLENIVTVEGIEPLVSKVFHLSFQDAYDIKDIVEAQLSARGKYTILETRSLPGWEFGGEGQSGAATEAGVRNRKEKEEIQKSKTFVVTDVPSAVTKIEKIIEQVDRMPQQILIEAKFLEISTGDLSDIGLDYIGGIENVEPYGTTDSIEASPIDDVLKVLNMTTGYPNPLNTAAAGGLSQDSGIRLSHSVLGSWGAEMAFALMAQDEDSNVLSAPKILTLNNQEAAILVGQKFPIIESQNNTGNGSSTTSTSLDYYENIGIQLNVIPQVCADNYINMIVHPAVSEIESFESGVVTAGSGVQSGTRYPLLRIREAETQILLKSDSTAVIGGLQTERDKEVVKKIPILGDIPFLGRLFRRETMTTEQVDLLIFIKASVIEPERYGISSAAEEERRTQMMDLDITKPDEEIKTNEETAAQPESAPGTDAESSEMLALVERLDHGSTTNAPAPSK
ncbi:secretin and TonB N-terminal domain-containing protein [Pontiellaceae bacterium B12227]|nr:secretin and TonB N-terminal domain-containing protein [Pontiellaceae bacterium B12227]